jgi:N-carbamoyl-L-amino-acid hydrolase
MSFDSMWAAIEPVGRTATGGYRRFAWTNEDREMREWFAHECESRGLDVVLDRMGNQWAWWGDIDATVAAGRRGVVMGSHLDSVPDGGAFDGPLGVVSALAALDVLRSGGFTPAVPIGIVSFVDEEGARFGVACAGSRVITGAMSAERARGLRDADGVTMAAAMAASGFDPAGIGRDLQTLTRIGAYLELHIEQGRALVDLDHAVAVGTSIWPHGRWRLDFPGRADHAGTTRLADRHDAMLGFATTVLTARAKAEQYGCLATMGKVLVEPGGVNAIPSHVTGWLDARGADEATVHVMVAAVSDAAREFGATVTQESWTGATTFARRLVSVLGEDTPLIPTGAGHDAGILADAGVPTAMLFVRNRTGISHSPEEFAETADVLAGITALAAIVADLAR